MAYKNREAARACCARYRKAHRDGLRLRAQEVKAVVCAHYGPNGALQCSFPDCEIVDLDMLTIDHKGNDGGKSRAEGEGSGFTFYWKLRRSGFPSGYQTLCWNHNWKKEALRRRGE